MENTVRIGIVGCGMVARYHAKAIADTPNAMLVGACSKSLSSTRTFCSEFPQVRAYDSYDEMLVEQDINTVAICSPTGDHYGQAKRALEAHKHVIVEKPICITLRQADDLIRLADEKSLSLCVISQTRFSDSAAIIKQAIEIVKGRSLTFFPLVEASNRKAGQGIDRIRDPLASIHISSEAMFGSVQTGKTYRFMEMEPTASPIGGEAALIRYQPDPFSAKRGENGCHHAIPSLQYG